MNRKEMLRLVLQTMTNRNLKIYQAFALHPPHEPPLFMQREDIIEYDGGKMLQIWITPNVITTDEDLKSLAIEDRNCFLEGEKYLRFFKIYTSRNCKVECFANLSSEICGCVPFDVIRDSYIPVCELLEYRCVQDLQYKIKLLEETDKSKSCNCLQSCNSVSYNYEFIETKFSSK